MRWIQPVLQIWSTEGRSSHEKVTIPKTETALQVVSPLTLNGTRVLVTRLCKYCEKSKYSCRRLGTHLRVCQTGSSSRACSTTSKNWESQKVQGKCLAQVREVATYAARFSAGYGCFCGSGSENWPIQGRTTISPICRR